MTFWKLFDGDTPHVSTAAFHADRERAPHLEQGVHRPRLDKAAELVTWYRHHASIGALTVVDLGCGDGGLLSLLARYPREEIEAWGYDFQPSNQQGWTERGVDGRYADVFATGDTFHGIELAELAVMTEVLEHVADPWTVLRRLHAAGVRAVVASSPATETDHSHCAEHAWAFDEAGYADLFTTSGWEILRHERVGMFQVVAAEAVR